VIITCPDCRSKYEIAGDRMPGDVTKLQCPRCKAVFPVRWTAAGSTLVAAAGEASAHDAGGAEPAPAPPAASPRPPRPPITDPGLARRLARAMISEMVLNRGGERDEALGEGKVLSRFGPSIAGAFALYREKVSEDLEAGPGLFREAVNEILGKGKRIL
jgi:predicted Zn finger-like uncharacterized protein